MISKGKLKYLKKLYIELAGPFFLGTLGKEIVYIETVYPTDVYISN